MKRITVAMGVLVFVVALASIGSAQMPGAGSIGKSAEKASKGDVSGAAAEAVQGVADAENSECKGKIDPYHQNIQYNTDNGGPDKISGAFGPCKVANQTDSYWSAKCDYKKFNYVQASCNKTNCSLYCYKR